MFPKVPVNTQVSCSFPSDFLRQFFCCFFFSILYALQVTNVPVGSCQYRSLSCFSVLVFICNHFYALRVMNVSWGLVNTWVFMFFSPVLHIQSFSCITSYKCFLKLLLILKFIMFSPSFHILSLFCVYSNAKWLLDTTFVLFIIFTPTLMLSL